MKAPTLPMRLKRQLSGGYVPHLLRGGGEDRVRGGQEHRKAPFWPACSPLPYLCLFLSRQARLMRRARVPHKHLALGWPHLPPRQSWCACWGRQCPGLLGRPPRLLDSQKPSRPAGGLASLKPELGLGKQRA